jgi:hypothetical protein
VVRYRLVIVSRGCTRKKIWTHIYVREGIGLSSIDCSALIGVLTVSRPDQCAQARGRTDSNSSSTQAIQPSCRHNVLPSYHGGRPGKLAHGGAQGSHTRRLDSLDYFELRWSGARPWLSEILAWSVRTSVTGRAIAFGEGKRNGRARARGSRNFCVAKCTCAGIVRQRRYVPIEGCPPGIDLAAYREIMVRKCWANHVRRIEQHSVIKFGGAPKIERNSNTKHVCRMFRALRCGTTS